MYKQDYDIGICGEVELFGSCSNSKISIFKYHFQIIVRTNWHRNNDPVKTPRKWSVLFREMHRHSKFNNIAGKLPE